MIVRISRESQDTKQTLGRMQVFKDEKSKTNLFECKTLELAWLNNHKKISCIPKGRYKVEKRNSTKYGDHFWVKDVPNRDMILIHHGNFFTHTLGCILVGQDFQDLNGDGILDVTNSRNTMERLNKMLPDNFELIIE